MKRNLLLHFFSLMIMMMFGFTGLMAQDTTTDASYNSQGRFGIRAGGVISKQKYDEGNLSMYTFPIGDGFLALQPELHWMQKGSTISSIPDNDLVTTMNYLELPLLLRVNFGGSLKLFAFGGPSAGYLLDVNSDNVAITKDDFEDIEFGLHIGAGIGFGRFEVDVRYMAGLSDVSAADGNVNDIKNSAFGAGLTYKF
ncbi:MAG: PorT family protein [Saprospiraceae bacterium]|nr:PorT family protein [Candidatus Opimibacter skivensis]